MEFEDYIKKYILDRLDSLEGQGMHGGELAARLYDADNCNGSITCNSAKSESRLEEYKYYFGVALSYNKSDYGDHIAAAMALDYFYNPEKAECKMVFAFVDAIVTTLLSDYRYQNKYLLSHYVQIDKEFIQWFKRNLDEAVKDALEFMEEHCSI